MKQSKIANFSSLFILIFTMSCQDQIGQNDSENQGQQENNSSQNQSTHDNQSSPNTGDNKWNTDPSDPEGRLVGGEWSDEDRFTIINPPLKDHRDVRTSFCDISKLSNSILIVEIKENIQTHYSCPYNAPPSEYRKSYTKMKVKRLLHLGGIRLPIEFELKNLGYEAPLPEGKKYIIGVAEIDGEFFSYYNFEEVILYNPEKTSDRVEFSGKKESLISNAEAHMKDRKDLCPNNHFISNEHFKEVLLDRIEGQCDYLNQ